MNPSLQQVASIFGAPANNIRRQYAKNALQLRDMARKAGSKRYRGKTSAEWSALADKAEMISKQPL